MEGWRQGFERTTIAEIAERAGLSKRSFSAVLHGLQALADELFEQRRDVVVRRSRIIDANPDLQERELGKRLALTDAIAEALRTRGLDPETTLLTARAGLLVQQTAMQRWTSAAGETKPLREFLAEALLSLRAVVNQAG